MIPLDVKKKSENHLAIIWDDGHESIYEMALLRKRCPCATCNAVKTAPKNDPLRVLSAQEILPENIQIREAEMVGRYALQFNWSDGHHEGIYSFDYLRQLCQCDDCKHVIKD